MGVQRPLSLLTHSFPTLHAGSASLQFVTVVSILLYGNLFIHLAINAVIVSMSMKHDLFIIYGGCVNTYSSGSCDYGCFYWSVSAVCGLLL